ncbi:hypothetical protein EJ02DRAFT_468143 [Clathrospora elynae]|uniref:Nucleic acid-binding protein n=1 Tax=Clathrospora elynae TaxID=706981 RepID=A0A6A5SFL9_9PLEO|nr:hypothetical protein EJ02DRAFT_468143 [Clathrospora elynae]
MRLKTLNGAPLCEHLDFSDSSLVSSEKCNAFNPPSPTAFSEDSTPALKWRCLASRDTRLRTGWSQPYLQGDGLDRDGSDISLSIPNVQKFPSLSQDDSTNLDTTVSFDDQSFAPDGFLQHSLVFHDTLLSSQVLQADGADKTMGSSSFMTTSFGTTTSEFSSPSRLVDPPLNPQVASRIAVTPLVALPSAQHLQAIYPQTPTPNLLCVLMANPEQREVLVRKGGYTMDLWEVTVADETRSGFKVTFWLRPPRGSNNEKTHAQNQLLQTLRAIKVGDILLLRNIALTSFRDNVHGQSLNPAITRSQTAIDVLMRSSGVAVGQLGGLPAVVVEKFMRVKRWARTHVASDHTGTRKRKGSATNWDNHAKRSLASPVLENSMPPDTMEGG